MTPVKFAAGCTLLVALHTLSGVAKDVSCDTSGNCSANDDDEASLVALRARGSRQPKLGFDEKVQEIFKQLDTNEDGALQRDEALEAGLQLIRGSAPTSVFGSIPDKNELQALWGDSVHGELNLDEFMQAAELARSSSELDRMLWWKETTTTTATWLSKTLTPQPVAAVVYSIGTGNHSAARLGLQACLSTWASNLPAGALQIIGRDQPAEMIYSATAWDPAPECEDSHAGGACKDAVGLVKGYKSGTGWVVLLGDDNYVFPHRLELALAQFDPQEPRVLGIPGCSAAQCSAGGLCGGGGQVFSRGALELMIRASGVEAFLAEQKKEAEEVGNFGDLANCRVASNRSLHVQELLGLHGWAECNEELAKDSLEALTFHYITPAQMFQVQKSLDSMPSALMETGRLSTSEYVQRYQQAKLKHVNEQQQRRTSLSALHRS
ncbi:unnamed protein product [Polarella glacialis]|uniref:EF-hand domain-containing protein n=2 Tax=Polarella glacialis TaxID=89957 RepID=A0A813M1P9_POLGL|nr:unnamed protein product [Polarella glacialis]